MNRTSRTSTTKQKIYYHLKNHGKSSGSELEMQATDWQTKPSVISRRCREMAEAGTIYRSLGERGTVQYSIYKPSMPTDKANALLKSLRQELSV